MSEGGMKVICLHNTHTHVLLYIPTIRRMERVSNGNGSTTVLGAAMDVNKTLLQKGLIRLVNINCNGLRSKRKKLALGSLLTLMKVGVCVVTESHLRLARVKSLQIPGYKVVANFCRLAPGRKIGGGVVILVKNTLTSEVAYSQQSDSEIVEACAIYLYPPGGAVSRIKITGIYISPDNTKELTLETLQRLSALNTETGESVLMPHLMIGDLNTTSWGDLFDEWCGEMSLWLISDPEVPTHNGGGVLDRILFFPGDYMPAAVFPMGDYRQDEEDDRRRGDLHYPALVFPELALSDHYPTVLTLPCDCRKNLHKHSRITIEGLTDEQWSNKNAELRELFEKAGLLREDGEPLSDQKTLDLNRYYFTMERLIAKVLRDNTRRIKQVPVENPMRAFLLRHAEHPKIDQLLNALERKETGKADRLIGQMSADGWRKYLGSVKRTNTKSMFKYLASEEGRSRWGSTVEEQAPMLADGRYITDGQGKSDLIAEAFRDRMNVSATGLSGGPSRGAADTEWEPDGQPLPPFREVITEESQPILGREIVKAIGRLALGKAPGPDGLTTLFFKKLTVMVSVLEVVLNRILDTGKIPKSLTRIYLVPLLKPGKDPHGADSRRPISLIGVTMKIMESVLYYRMLPGVEAHLDPRQYAYRQGRGTEMVLAEIMDFAHRSLRRARYVYMISFDVQGAFDNVPHHRLMEAMKAFRVNPYIRRVVHNWLRNRTFQVKLRAYENTYLSSIYGVTKGLPQGGVLSPILWLMFFNHIAPTLEYRRVEHGVNVQCFRDFLYADDLTTLLVGNSREELEEMARFNYAMFEELLGECGLRLNKKKTQNLIFSPLRVPEGVYRRSPERRYPNTKTRLANQYRQEASTLQVCLEFDPYTQDGKVDLQESFPVPIASSVRVLGVEIDQYMTLDVQFKETLRKAQQRQGILARMSRFDWGLETGVLCMTHTAIITSLLRYGMIMVGSCLPPDTFDKIETQIVNIAARKVGGLDRSTRIEALHFLTHTHSYKNLYIMHCADLIDAAIRSQPSSIGWRVRMEVGAALGVRRTVVDSVELKPLRDQWKNKRTPPTVWKNTHWFVHKYRESPDWEKVHNLTSIYACNAHEINSSIFHRVGVCHFAETASWIDLGLQVLRHIRWSYECATPSAMGIRDMLPPRELENLLHFRGDVNSEGDATTTQKTDKRYRVQIQVNTTVVRPDRLGLTVCILRREGRVEHRSIIVHGEVITTENPRYLEEITIAHSLGVLREWVQQGGPKTENLARPIIRTGDYRAVHALERWCQTGTLGLETAATTAILRETEALKHWAQNGLHMRPLYLPEAMTPEETPGQYQELYTAAEEFRHTAESVLGGRWFEDLPKVPLTRAEVQELIREQMDRDELMAMRQLATLESESAVIIVDLELTRGVIQEALGRLREDRAAQVTLASILSATRYRIYSHGRRLPTRCGKCRNAQDSFGHMIRCYALEGEVARGSQAVEFLVKMARVTKTKPPGLSLPFVRDLR